MIIYVYFAGNGKISGFALLHFNLIDFKITYTLRVQIVIYLNQLTGLIQLFNSISYNFCDFE